MNHNNGNSFFKCQIAEALCLGVVQ